MRIISTIRGSELGGRPIRCCVLRKPVKNPERERYYKHRVVELWLFVDPVLAAILWKLLNESKTFCMSFTIWLYNQWNTETKSISNNINYNSHLSLCISNIKSWSVDYTCLRANVNIELIYPNLLNITPDIRWSERLWPLLVEFAHLNDIMSWLSTLGGAYSSLGEHCTYSSKKAGEISRQQFLIASRLKNPILAAQCNLFLAMSLVQRGYLKPAIKIIRQQYANAICNGVQDPKLIALCKAVWNKIRYKKQLKLQAKRATCHHEKTFS